MLENTSLSHVYSVTIPKTGPVKNLNRMTDSAKNCLDVLIVGEKCRPCHLCRVKPLGLIHDRKQALVLEFS